MTRRELLRRIDASERLDWQVLEDVDPWGQRRDDYRAAMLAWIMAGGKSKMSDFILDFLRPPEPPRPPRKQSPEEIETIMRMWIKGSNVSFTEQRVGRA
jgi:hypothetical protein